jgi:hypothetical protein
MGFPTSAEKMLEERMAPMGLSSAAPPIFNWKPIGHHGLEGAVRGDIIWLRGPCGAVHPLSHEAARELARWLADQAAPTIDGKAEGAQATFARLARGRHSPAGFT